MSSFNNPQQQQQQQQETMSPSPLIWFLLLDSATGEPYKGTIVSSVLRSLVVPVVDQFRDAVKAKYSNKLASFDAGELLVYANKAAFDKRHAEERKEGPLKSSHPLKNLGQSDKEQDMLIVAVPSPISSIQGTSLTGKKEPTNTLQSLQEDGDAPLVVKSTAVLELQLVQLDQEIKALEDSDEYKTLDTKNRAWTLPKPTEQEKREWQLLEKKLADLKKKEDFYQKAILSTNSHSVKKSDKTRKGYKKDTAIKDERLLLSDVAIKMWKRFGFTLENNGKPTFGDFKRAAGFKDDADVRNYFRKSAKSPVVKDAAKESLKDAVRKSFTEKEWIWLIGLNQRVNGLLHDTLIANQDGSLRLVLEHGVYEDGVELAENVVRTLYGPEKKVDIKDASSDSSTSP